MIAANELRIGSWVSISQNEADYFQINEDSLEILFAARDYDTLIPIPLNEEILLKCGFILRGIYYHFPNHDIFKLEQYRNKNAYWLRHSSESLDSVRINYLHQLQNLYFALTGTELEINL